MTTPSVTIVGAGLAGSEAALQLAGLGVSVRLLEMRALTPTPAHETTAAAELVCSNSFRGDGLSNAVGLLKEELRRLGGALIRLADTHAVPAGGALAVDRRRFSAAVETELDQHPLIQRESVEVTSLDDLDGPTILATGPLTSDALAASLIDVTGEDALAFYDAIAPIIEADSIDLDRAFFQSRYDKGEGKDYINCPFDREGYLAFVRALREAEQASRREFEDQNFFEACLPAEVMAGRGDDVLAFGPMKPVGLTDPRTGKQPAAVVQLRAENLEKTAYNMVGFQTRIRWDLQREIFRTIPGLEKAVFLRHGSVHRNTFVHAPRVLDTRLALRARPHVHMAGQITGVEGYVESMAIGFLVARIVAAEVLGRTLPTVPNTLALGGLYRHVTGENLADPSRFQPSNVNWGMLPPLRGKKGRRTTKRLRTAERALETLTTWQRALEDAGLAMPGTPKHTMEAAWQALRERR